ncbi:MAG: protease modulator HflK [Thermoguttaceae bacterium]|nr:protease modulator HflK [Thermoguttaceae bacterium]
MAQKKTSKAVYAGLDAGMKLFRWIVLLLVILFWFSGITSVKPGNVGMLMRFGKLQGKGEERIMKPGLALALPYPIDEVIQTPELKIEQLEINEIFKPLDGGMGSLDSIDPLLEGYALTGDMNVIQTKIVVKYKVSDPIAFRLGVDKPEAFLHDIVLTAFTQTAANWTIDDLLRQRQGEEENASPKTEQAKPTTINKHSHKHHHHHAHGHDEDGHDHDGHDHDGHDHEDALCTIDHSALEQQVRFEAMNRVNELDLGVEIVSVEFREIHPPRHVNQAFENVRNARTQIEEQRYKAEKYASQVVPAAEQASNAMIQDAKAYKEKLLAETKAMYNRFEPVYQEYQNNKDVVRQRVYLETLEEVFDNVGQLRFLPPETKVVLPDEGGK